MRVFVILGILSVLFVLLYRSFQGLDVADGMTTYPGGDIDVSTLVPEGNRSDVIRHKYYTIGYNESHEQPDWVVYELRAADLKTPNVPRARRFKEDPMVTTSSARHSDYTRSGYSRGHMAPAGDMAFNQEAMQESFYMSNMSPQLTGYNGGVWRELEESVRDWAYEEGQLLVASGPIFSDLTQYIGNSSKVRVPEAFYKIIVARDSKRPKGVGFVIPHEVTERPLTDFAVTIDDLEAQLGLDFFDQNYQSNEVEEAVESQVDISRWPLSKKRYQNRINHWNNN